MPFQESKKNGYFRGLQRYKCLDCNHIFNNKRRDHKTNTSKKIWQDYIDHKQTVQELCQQHSVSHPTIEKYLDNYQITKEIVYPSQAVVVMDTTYFGRGFGVIIKELTLTEERKSSTIYSLNSNYISFNRPKLGKLTTSFSLQLDNIGTLLTLFS